MTDRERWNKKYQERKLSNFKAGASQFLLAQEDFLSQLPKGPGLDIASGYGRNSFYLEKLGFTMDAVDVSDLAMDWLAGEAKKNELNIEAHRRDLAIEDFPKEKYQIIICFNFLYRPLFERIYESLHPGGVLIYETVYEDDLSLLGNKMNPDYVLGQNELLSSFRNMRILSYQEKIREMSTGRKKALASLFAIKS